MFVLRPRLRSANAASLFFGKTLRAFSQFSAGALFDVHAADSADVQLFAI
jgi:hypothetical protein